MSFAWTTRKLYFSKFLWVVANWMLTTRGWPTLTSRITLRLRQGDRFAETLAEKLLEIEELKASVAAESGGGAVTSRSINTHFPGIGSTTG
uniref:Secreted protein n=1 Tax=Panagrellus redivivus TaxID=6233 RepID=A0A7E4ZZM3_PANRE